MPTISAVDVLDIRFPTSRSLDGSDAMNPDPDYSAAYVVIRTDAGDGLEGHGLTFTIGRGTEVVVAGVRALERLVLGRSTDDRCTSRRNKSQADNSQQAANGRQLHFVHLRFSPPAGKPGGTLLPRRATVLEIQLHAGQMRIAIRRARRLADGTFARQGVVRWGA